MLSEFPGKYFLWRPAVHICQLSQTCSETKVTFLKASGLKKKGQWQTVVLNQLSSQKNWHYVIMFSSHYDTEYPK